MIRQIARAAGLALIAAGVVFALGGCDGSNPPSGSTASSSTGGGGGNTGGGGGNTGGGGGGGTGSGSGSFRAFAFNDDLIFGTAQNAQGPAAWIWVMSEVASGHTSHVHEEASSASGPWTPSGGVVWSGPAINGGSGPGVLFTFPMPTSNTFYRVSATDGTGNTVTSNVIVADVAASASPGAVTITGPTVSNDPNNPAVVPNVTSISWSGGTSPSSHVVLLVDFSVGDFHTIAEQTAAPFSIGSTGTTAILTGAALSAGSDYGVEVIGLDANAWGTSTSADVTNGFNNFFQPQ
jgi:hypothetical protein